MMLCFYTTKNVHAENFIFENGFEEGMGNWKTNNSQMIFNILNDPVSEGTQSAGLSNSSTTSYGIEHIISDINEEENYQISGRIKVNDPPPSKAFIRIAWYASPDGSGSQIRTDDSEIISSITDWKEITFAATSPANAESAKIRLLVSNGAAFFDDISVLVTDVQVPVPTPTAILSVTINQNTSPTITPHAIEINNISISEVMTYPESGQKEWVELHNGNDSDVTILSWYFDDTENGGASPKQFSAQIPAHGYAVIELSSSIFNNAADEVRILDLNLNLTDSFAYESSDRGISWGRSSDNTFCKQNPSRNYKNNNCNPTIMKTVQPTITKLQSDKKISSSIQNIKSSPIKPSINKFNSFYEEFTNQTQSKPETLGVTDISIPESNSSKLDKTLALIAGSNSLLALISLVSKTFIFRYT